MTAALAPFDFQGQTVRVVTDEHGDPWFVARDVCLVLELPNVGQAVSRLADDEKGVTSDDTLGGVQQFVTISEPGLYRLIFTSRKQEAETFRRWVTHEVLPAIRKTGSYIAPQSDADRALALAHQVIALHTQVKELAPRAAVADKILNATGDYSVADAAKALTRAGLKLGERRLFTVLEHKGWISRGGDGRFRPKQYPLERQWMSLLPQSHYHPRTAELILDAPQCRVTPKGIERLLADLQPGTAVAS